MPAATRARMINRNFIGAIRKQTVGFMHENFFMPQSLAKR